MGVPCYAVRTVKRIGRRMTAARERQVGALTGGALPPISACVHRGAYRTCGARRPGTYAKVARRGGVWRADIAGCDWNGNSLSDQKSGVPSPTGRHAGDMVLVLC